MKEAYKELIDAAKTRHVSLDRIMVAMTEAFASGEAHLIPATRKRDGRDTVMLGISIGGGPSAMVFLPIAEIIMEINDYLPVEGVRSLPLEQGNA